MTHWWWLRFHHGLEYQTDDPDTADDAENDAIKQETDLASSLVQLYNNNDAVVPRLCLMYRSLMDSVLTRRIQPLLNC